VFSIVGWGRYVGPNVWVRAEFREDGTVALTRSLRIFRRRVVSAPADWVMLNISTQMVTEGGGWWGGGFGIRGALRGRFKAQILNWLTTRHDEYVMLAVVAFLEDGSHRDLVVGFPRLRESQLRAMLAEALPRWTDLFVERTLADVERDPPGAEEAARRLSWLEQVERHQTLSTGQLARLREAYTRLGGPPIEAPSPPHDPEPVGLPASPDPGIELQRLAYMRATGSISEDEFERRRAQLGG
jgi:hypothetical protein